MRLDKLTTAFQQALGDAQSAAVARDNPYIEPAHLLAGLVGRIARFKQPHRVVQMDSLPRTALGKVQRTELTRALMDRKFPQA